MNIPGRKWTDEELARIEQRLHEIYTQANAEITAKADTYFRQFRAADIAKKKMVDAGTLSKDDYLRWRRTQILTGEKWTRMREQAALDLYNVNRTALDYVNGRLPDIYAVNYNFQARDIQNGVSSRVSFELVDAQTVRNLSFEDNSLLPYKKLDPKKDIPWNMRKINSECLQGILQGESMPEIAQRLQKVGVQNEVSAMRAARTIVNGAENKGRYDCSRRAEDMGVIVAKKWISVSDGRTRDWHADAGFEYGDDESAIPVDEPFVVNGEDMMYPGAAGASPENVYNCRCGYSIAIRGFRPTLSKGTIKVRFD